MANFKVFRYFISSSIILFFHLFLRFTNLYIFPIFRYNDFQNDPVANVSGCDHLTPAGSLANRLDLSDPNSTCTFSGIDDMVGHSAYGALDAKLGIPII